MSEKAFFTFKKVVEILENAIEKAKFSKEKLYALKDEILAIKTGANLPLDFFYKEVNLRNFLEINDLEKIFFLSKLNVRYDRNKGAILPFEGQGGSINWILWEDLIWEKTKDGYDVSEGKNLLFKTDRNTYFTNDYTALMYGITKYNKITSANFRPYRYEDPASYDHKYLLQVVVNWGNQKNFSYFFQTHAYMELKGPDGMVRSVGQDIFDHLRTLSIFSINNAINRSSIITTPDKDCYSTKVGRNRKRITFELTKKEFQQVIALVESDKYNHQSPATVLKGNCVSYTCRILKEVLKYDIKGDVNGLEIFWRNRLPRVFDKFIVKICQKFSKLPTWAKKVLFFLPPVILFSAMVGTYGKLTSRKGFKKHTHYKLSDFFFRPWMVRVDLPFQLYSVLSAYADENGVIKRGEFPPGSVFD